MDDDTPTPAPASPPSKTPSWVLLGFVIGAAFVWLLPRPNPPPAPTVRPESPPLPGVQEKRDLTVIEAVFSEWGGSAIWENDLTEVALWDAGAGAFTGCYEVLRSGGNYYFRPIDRLTRPVLTHGDLKPESPLRFTEPEAMRQAWLREKTQEDWKAISDSMKSPKP